MKCDSCGASISSSARFCEYCGSTVKREGPASTREIFTRIKESPAYGRREDPVRHASLPKMNPLLLIIPIIVGVMFIIIPGTMMGMAAGFGGRMGGLSLVFTLFPLLFMCIGVGVIIYSISSLMKFHNSPIRGDASIVKGKRLSVSGGGNNSSASTTYYITFEDERGQREEYRVLRSDLYSRLSEGDAGVVYTRDKYVLDMDRVEV